MSIFLTDDAELRSGWRCALYVTIFVVVLFATVVLLSGFLSEGEFSTLAELALNGIVLFPPAAVTLWFMSHWVDRLPIAVFGAGFHERWSRDLYRGLLVAALMIALYIAVGALVGQAIVEVPEGGIGWREVGIILLIFGLAAANEELIFRGYVLQVLMVGIGRVPGVILVSALFGLAHHSNPNATWMGTTNVFLAGILLSLAYLRTRSLWFPYGLHIGWNAGTGVVLGFPVSGVEVPTILDSELAGPAWLTGGSFGPEGGILGTGVIIAAVVFVAGSGRWLSVSPRIQTLLDRHSAKIYNSHHRDAHQSITSGGS